MTRTTRHSITVLLALAGTFGLVGISGALEGEDPTLDDVECVEGSTDPACDVPDDTTTTTVDDTTTTTVEDGTVDDGTTEDVGDDVVEPEVGPVDNHGAAVSTAAHECPPGPEHGPCVREVAKSDAGKPSPELEEETEDEPEEPVEPAEDGKGGRPEGKGKPAR